MYKDQRGTIYKIVQDYARKGFNDRKYKVITVINVYNK